MKRMGLGSKSMTFLLTVTGLILYIVCADSWAAEQQIQMMPDIDRLLSASRIKGPIDFCGEPVPIHIPDIRERLEKEMVLMLADSAQVILWLKRFPKYRTEIETQLKEVGLPDDLKYIPVVESALLPLAGSPKGAMGHWQFIPDTGQRYGLLIDSDIDERRNLTAATRSAIQYLQFLYGEFQSWTLAAAAYNMGEDGLKTEMFLQDMRDFYQLYLFQETQRYVLRIVAVKMILSRPQDYGYRLQPSDYYSSDGIVHATIELKRAIPVLLLARAAQTSFKTIRDLNPEIRGYVIPAGVRTIDIPALSANGFNDRLQTMTTEFVSGQNLSIYTVQKGDNLTLISKRLGIPIRALLLLNRMDSRTVLHPGNQLFISPMSFTE
ncbi:MAG: transglycosylase SLT domain-containing protein [Desulfatirhabdiaceae bacterium]